MTADKRESLAAFRHIARDVRESPAVISRDPLSYILYARVDQSPKGEFRGHARDPLWALAVAIRRAYMTKERGNFGRVCNIIHQHGSEEQRQEAKAIRAAYKQALKGDRVFEVGLKTHESRTLFHNWLNGVVFHDDPEKRAAYDEVLTAVGPIVEFDIQGAALRVARCIVDLDHVVADLLGEARLPLLE